MKRTHYLIVILLTLILFTITSFIHTNSICCMFASTRSYGFPGEFIIISKETNSLEEAQKVNSFSTEELLKQGWQVKFGANMNSPISQSATFNVILNIVVYYIISMFGILLVNFHYKRKL